MKALLAGIFTTRKDNELIMYRQIMSTMNSLLEKKMEYLFFNSYSTDREQKKKLKTFRIMSG